MDTTTDTKALAANDVKALRLADRVCFDHSPTEAGIRAISSGPAPFRHEITLEVPAAGSVRVHGLNLDYDTRYGKTATCFAMIYPGAVWRTIAGLLRKGDELRLEWVGADNNGYLSGATVTREKPNGEYTPGLGERLYHDRLYLKVWRKGKERYAFHVTDSITPNNTARMIRP